MAFRISASLNIVFRECCSESRFAISSLRSFFSIRKVRTQVAIAIGLLIFYWLLVKLVPAPGFAAGDLTKEGSLPSYIDRVVFGKHVWAQARVYDPEGLLSTIPSIATSVDWSVDR